MKALQNWVLLQVVGKLPFFAAVLLVGAVVAGWNCTTKTGSLCFKSMPAIEATK